jgi:hypothetical protein
VRGIDVRVSRTADGALSLTYTIEGELARVRIPAPAQARFADRLWQHTCCELFARRGHGPAYRELNFSPSGEWAAFGFERYREGTPLVDEALAPHIAVRSARGKFELDAVIRLDCLSLGHGREPLSLALSAVIEDSEGGLSYWALAHSSAQPDFHHPDAFALQLGDE